MKPTISWVVIANGTEAKFFENTGPDKGLKELSDLKEHREHRKTSDIVTHERGRTFSSSGNGRSAMEQQTDPADKEHEDFSRHLAETLNEKARNNAFDRIIVAAPPQTLGELRKYFDGHMDQKIKADLAKDLTSIPTNKLPNHFKDIIAL